MAGISLIPVYFIILFPAQVQFKMFGKKLPGKSLFTVRRTAVSQLVLIGCILSCLEVKFSRISLIDQKDDVGYRGMMGKYTNALGPIIVEVK